MNKEILVWINQREDFIKDYYKYPKCSSELTMLKQIRKELKEKDKLEEILNSKKVEPMKEPILDDVEKRYLKNVLRPFKDRIIYVKKLQSTACRKIAYLYVAVKDDSYMMFPRFNKNTMYKNMKINKEYTLEELGITYE